jgi:hypothetical protein
MNRPYKEFFAPIRTGDSRIAFENDINNIPILLIQVISPNVSVVV